MSRFVESMREGPVATVTIDRSARHNSLTPALLDEFVDVVEAIADEAGEAVSAVVLRTAGASFSTGGDVRGFYENRDRLAAYAERTVGRLNDAILALRGLPVPVVVAVDGRVTGGSLGFLLAADVVYVTPDAGITPYYAVVGFSPDGGWTAMLPRVIGAKRTARVLLTNETIDPTRAVEWGLASEVVDPEYVHERARETARRIASMKPGVAARTKRLLDDDRDALAARLDRERRSFVEQIQTAEALDGMRSFLE